MPYDLQSRSFTRARTWHRAVFTVLVCGLVATTTADARRSGDAASSIDATVDTGHAGLLAAPFLSDGFPLAGGRSRSFAVSPQRFARLANGGAVLEIDPGAVAAERAITIQPLAASQVPRLDAGMTNVTGGAPAGFRFLPHQRFAKPIEVRTPYREEAIPAGTSAHDLQTFFFDEASQDWKALERVAVDKRRHEVISLTTHFTNMITAAVTVPDHPQLQALAPTAIKDVQPASPGAGVDLIAPPAASNTGDARLSYPLRLPPGRAGLQPSLSLTYSSSAANGWLGTGWDLSVPTVTVETRWGVPRYDRESESESYLLSGEQLTPSAHRAQQLPRTAERAFQARVEGQFQRIIRHGDTPATYWWEVVDKTGTRYFYGGSPEDGAAGDATLATAEGAIFRWGLREVRDLHGNTIHYRYDKVSAPAVAGGAALGSQLYPRAIDYTGTTSQTGPYSVRFEREAGRPDVSVDARGGFLMVTAERLRRVEVRFKDQLIRRYELAYERGAFEKSLLDSISLHGSDGALFNRHEFGYDRDVRNTDDTYHGFTAANWDTPNDDVSAGLLDHGEASALSGSVTNSLGGHLYVGFSVAGYNKQLSGGGKVGFSHGDSDAVLAMIDLNGDGLPDKVFKRHDGAIVFHLNRARPGGTNDFEPQERRLPTLPGLGSESTNTASFGLEAYFGASVLLNRANTYATGSVYFSDVNADGLPDLVDHGRVLFNRLVDNVPTFAADSNGTPAPLGGPGRAVDASRLVADPAAQRETNVDAFPLQDALRRWTAPFDGTVRIAGAVGLVRDTSDERSRYGSADGVRVAIQRNGSELWAARIAGDDYESRTPSGVEDVEVRRGDRIYFRTQSVDDGRYDRVSWDPEIEYVGREPVTDVNGLPVFRYRASEDFVLAGRSDVDAQAPVRGTVKLTGILRKLGATTDDIRLEVVKVAPAGAERIVTQRSLAWDATGEIAVDEQVEVESDDRLRVRVRVDSPIDLHRLQWTVSPAAGNACTSRERPDEQAPLCLFYVASPKINPLVDTEGRPVVQVAVPADMDIYPTDDLTGPQPTWLAPRDGTIKVASDIATRLGDTSTDSALVLTAKQRGAQRGKRRIVITNGRADQAEMTLDVHEGDELFFDYSTLDRELAARLARRSVSAAFWVPEQCVTLPPPIGRLCTPAHWGDSFAVPSTFHSAAATGTFPQPYRQWAAGGYNGNRERATQPIDEAAFDTAMDRDQYEKPECKDEQLVQQDPVKTSCNPVNAGAAMFAPIGRAWQGSDPLVWVGASESSSSRVGPDSVDVPTAQDIAGAQAVDRLSFTGQTAAQVGVAFLSGSASGKPPLEGRSFADVDYLDLNGDRYPDIVGTDASSTPTPTGRLEPDSRPVAGLERVRESDNEALNFGISGSPARSPGPARAAPSTTPAAARPATTAPAAR